MKKAMLACALYTGVIASVEATTLHRWPLDYYAPATYSRWFDRDSRAGFSVRYDGGANPGGDGHNGTDILVNISPTYVRAGAFGSLYYRENACNNNGFLGNACGSGYGNHWLASQDTVPVCLTP